MLASSIAGAAGLAMPGWAVLGGAQLGLGRGCGWGRRQAVLMRESELTYQRWWCPSLPWQQQPQRCKQQRRRQHNSHWLGPHRYLGLECHLVLRNSAALADSDPGLVGNLLVDRLVGAHIHQARCAALRCAAPRCGTQLLLPAQSVYFQWRHAWWLLGARPLRAPNRGSASRPSWAQAAWPRRKGSMSTNLTFVDA